VQTLKDENRGLALDEDYAFFIKQFGAPTTRQEVPESSVARYENKLPGQLIEYWKEFGWCGYGDGLFWTVNPQEYEAVLAQWLVDTELYHQDNYYVIARSAFGDLYVWGEKSGYCVTIAAYMARFSTRVSIFTGEKLDFGVRVFFSSMDPDYNDLDFLFKPAVEKLGKLKADEMYGLVPALALGGSIDLEHVEKVKTIEHLEFLSQLSPLTDWDFPKI
jgi:hypothetical protein